MQFEKGFAAAKANPGQVAAFLFELVNSFHYFRIADSIVDPRVFFKLAVQLVPSAFHVDLIPSGKEVFSFFQVFEVQFFIFTEELPSVIYMERRKPDIRDLTFGYFFRVLYTDVVNQKREGVFCSLFWHAQTR
jgi:hypothetical protein